MTDIEENAIVIFNNVLTTEVRANVSKIIELREKIDRTDGIEQKQLVLNILQAIGQINSHGAHIGSMALTILISCLKQELDCLENEDAAWRLAEAYLNFINTIKAAQQYLLNISSTMQSIKEGLKELFTLRRGLDLKALYLFSAIAKNQACSQSISKSSLLTHFIADCWEDAVRGANSAFLTAVLLYRTLLSTADVLQLLRFAFVPRVETRTGCCT